MKTETVSFLKQNAARLELEEPMLVTQNGKPLYVVESYESSRRREEAISLLKIVALGQKDIAAGRVKPMSSLKERLAERKRTAIEERKNAGKSM